MDVEHELVAGWQGLADRWRVRIDFARSGRVKNIAAEGLLRSAPRSAAGGDCFSAPRAQRTHGTSGDGDGLFVCGCPLLRQYVPATGIGHEHSPALSLKVLICLLENSKRSCFYGRQ